VTWLLVLPLAPDVRFTRAHYDAIEIGMTLDQVETVMGCATREGLMFGDENFPWHLVAEESRNVAPSWRDREYTWFDQRGSIFVTLVNDRVVRKQIGWRVPTWRVLADQAYLRWQHQIHPEEGARHARRQKELAMLMKRRFATNTSARK
jgi:hypothetical protein